MKTFQPNTQAVSAMKPPPLCSRTWVQSDVVFSRTWCSAGRVLQPDVVFQPAAFHHRRTSTSERWSRQPAVVWHGRQDVSIDTVPDPVIADATDAIIRVTSSGLCGSDLHLYTVLAPFMTSGNILGHEPMGIVEEVGSAVTNISIGDRVVIPFNISCGHCFMCDQGLQSQCETTQVRDQDCGAALFGYTKLYGQVPGGQAELLRVPHANYGPIKVPEGPGDDRFLFLSDVLPTAWQAVQYAATAKGSSLVVLGLGPIGDMACRIAQHLGAETVIGVDLVPERLSRAAAHGVEVIDWIQLRQDERDHGRR